MSDKKVMDRNKFQESLLSLSLSAQELFVQRGLKMFDALTEDERQKLTTVNNDAERDFQYMRLARTLLCADEKVIGQQFMVEAIRPDVKRAKRILNRRVW